ncbi:MAG: T9SS type A sorting domain-containing protein [Ignavibacteria bacterium]|nr:T9SS type A sorting domain-containing protein [Ignavibacteria bacterium]
MVTDGSGGYFIFWTDLRNYGQNEADLYGQRLDAAGNKLWTSAGKKIADSVFYSVPKAVYTSDGNIIVLYSTTNGGGRVWAKKINTAGISMWSVPFYIAGWPQLGADIYNAVTDKSGGIIITYQVTWGGGTTLVFAQRVSSNGTVKWSPASNGLNLSESGECRAPVITSDERGGAHIFYYNVPGPYNVWKSHVDSSGNFLPKTALYLTPNNYPLIRAVSDGVGGAVIAWATNGGGATQSDIYAQRINLAGAVQWNATGNVVCNENGAQTSLNLSRTSDGNYIIVWTDGRRVFINNDVYCQKLNAAGNTQWTSNGVLVTNYSTYYPEPNLISDNSGGAYIFVYNSQTNFSVARIKSDSTFSWTPNLRTLASSIYNPSYHRFQLAKNGDGAIAVWQTFNGVGANGLGIYGAKINGNGTINIKQVSTEIPESFSLKQNYPNPFNPVTNLEFGISDLGFVSLKVYNILGNEVETLVNKNLAAGSYSVEWEATKYPSGVYFYKLETENFTEVKRMMLVK